MTRKTTIRYSLKLIGVDDIFKEGFGPGVVAISDVDINKGYERGEPGYHNFRVELERYIKDFITSQTEVIIEDITDD